MKKSFVESSVRFSSVLLMPVMAVWASTAHAQVRAQAQANTQERDHYVLGVGAAATPVYWGSDEYRVIPIPAIDIKKGWFFANLRNGIGIAPIDNGTITIGASAAFVPGYRNRDVPDGIDKLSSGAGARLFTNVRTGGFVGTLGATKIISGGTEGLIADASLSYPVRISPRFTLTPTVGGSWADEKHNDRYFGITTTESLASGLPQYEVGSGFNDVSAALTASYRLTDRITLSATGSVSSLLGDAADSPLVEKTTQPSAALTLTYRM